MSQFVKDVSYTFMANVVSSLVSAATIILLPKFMGVADYGYWQFYLLVMLYASFLHLGLADGYYLRYSGTDPEDQDCHMFSSLFVFLAGMIAVLLLVLGIILYFSDLFTDSPDKRFVLWMTIIATFLLVLRVFIQMGWQAVSQFKQNAQVIILERILFLVAAVVFAIVGIPNFKLLIFFDLGVKAVALVVSIYMARRCLFKGLVPFKDTLKEAWRNINAGVKIMLAGTISSFIVGSVQFIIQGHWDIETYSKVSLTLTLSNLVLVFINAVALTLLPQVRKLERHSEQVIYQGLLDVVVFAVVIIMNAYYPLVIVAGLWLPAYQDSLHYMALLFPICLFECKTALVTNTYLKSLRKERGLLNINIVVLCISFSSAYYCAFYLDNLVLTVGCILFSLALRSIISEIVVNAVYNQPVWGSIFVQCILTASFVVAQWVIGGVYGALAYAVVSIIYCLVVFKQVMESAKYLNVKIIKD